MNFFKKNWIAILIILFFSIVFIIGFFEGINEAKQEQKSLSNYLEELEDNEEPKQPSRAKREIETPKSKIKITQTNYDKIKSYILSENENEVLSLNNLSQDEKNEIEKIKNSWKNSLVLLQKSQDDIDEQQQKCDNYNKQINKLDPRNELDANEIEMFNDMLLSAENYKKILKKRHKDYETMLKNSTTFSLKSLYEITSSEG